VVNPSNELILKTAQAINKFSEEYEKKLATSAIIANQKKQRKGSVYKSYSG